MEIFGVNAIWVIALCGVLCFGSFFVGIMFSLLDVVFTVIGAIIELILELFNTGPVPGCGCVVVLGLIFGCGAFMTWYLNAAETCGTADAVILCRFI